jgi:hypothetical protein
VPFIIENMIIMDVQRFINFDDLITPKCITIFYVLGVILITIVSVYTLSTVYSPGYSYSSYYGSSYSSQPSYNFVNFMTAVLFFVLGNLFWRIACELVIVIFKINEHAGSINDYFTAIKQNS